MKAVNLFKELELVDDYWSPRIIGEANDQYIKVAKLKGAIAWHKPVAEDECWIALIETVTTKHTGDVVTDRTKSLEQQLGGS